MKSEKKYQQFNGLGISCKYGICGLPLRFDSYQTCGFKCVYCFSNNRSYMANSKQLKVAKLSQIRFLLSEPTRCERYKLLQALLFKGITVHCGSLSDPFQPINKELHITNQAIDIFNEHNVHLLFSTKSDTVHDANIRNDLHSFQLSVSNVKNIRKIEPNVPSIERRLSFFNDLKTQGFKVGIRIQPFIPDISTLEILDMFHDADHFTIEGIKLNISSKDSCEDILNCMNLKKEQFENNASLWRLNAEERIRLYKPFIEWFNKNNKSYSIADNDLRFLGNNYCCCGDCLVNKATGFDTTCMLRKYGRNYSLENVLDAIDDLGIGDYAADYYAPAKDCMGSKTLKDFIVRRFNAKRSNVSPKYQYGLDME